MIFIHYQANDGEIRVDENSLAPLTVEKKRVLPTRPIPLQARRNFLLPDRDRVKEEDLKKKPDETEVSENKHLKSRYLIKFLFDNFGVLLVAVAYIVCGAYIFQFIEQPNEIASCQTGEGVWKKLLYDYRVMFYNYIYYNTTSNEYLLKNDPYAIPSLVSSRDNSTVYQPKLTQMLQDFRDEILSITSDFNYAGQDCVGDSQWNTMSAILFTMSIVTTIGIPLFLIGLNRLGVFLGEVYKYVYMKVFCFICNRRKTIAKNMARKKKELKYQVSEEKYNGFIIDDLEDDEEKKVTVPLVLILLSVIGYLLIGGYFFTQLGEEWTLVQSIYCSYQAVSTIGFGDYVSGWTFIQNNQPGLGGRNLLISCCYSLIGMSILGMVFNLMQDTIKDKFEKIKEVLNMQETPLKDEIENVSENQIDSKKLNKSFEGQERGGDSPGNALKEQLAVLKSLKEEKILLKTKKILGIEDKKKMLAEKINQRLPKSEMKNLPKAKSKPESPPEARSFVNPKNRFVYELQIYEKLNNI